MSPDTHHPVTAARSDVVDPGVPVEAAPRPAPAATADRWRRAAVYRIHAASFADADGDGVGDLAGIASRIPYLRDLGIDAVRLDEGSGAPEEIGTLAAALHTAHLGLIVEAPGTAPGILASWAEHDVDALHVDGRLVPVRAESETARSGISTAAAADVDLTAEDFAATSFRRRIEQELDAARTAGIAPTWMLSTPDAVRHATRFAFLPGVDVGPAAVEQWLGDGGDIEEVPVALGLARARAASLFVLALPGSTSLYQGEELGLQEVGDIPSDRRQDPTRPRNPGVDVEHDGCRVPIPWTVDGPSYGFGDTAAQLPQPAWFGGMSVEAEATSPGSTLTMYRAALAYRAYLQTEETLEWLDTGRADVLHIRRPGGWSAVLHTGRDPYPMPDGRVLLASRVLPDPARIPADTAVWILED